jgi:superfamily II RNA helicase
MIETCLADLNLATILAIDIEKIFPFKLDDFQLEAISHLNAGKNVVVCAPTGSGKTVIAEYAIELALKLNKRCFYTTPLKALSNQKLHDLQIKYGEDKVGLLTGDVSVNREASIVVMTTEVFRNMLYGTILGDINKNLHDVSSVILDEFHYMNDAQRGTVWEESIIYTPENIQLIALSATIANAQELTNWIDQTHGPTSLVVSEYRPVPLRFYYFYDRRLFPMFSPGGAVNSQLKGMVKTKPKRFGPKRRHKEVFDVPKPRDVLKELHFKKMLPAIFFLFSRRGCEEALENSYGTQLLTPEEKSKLTQEVNTLVKDNNNLKNHPHLEYLLEGMAVHHAGMLPSWKGVVEKLFQKGLIKIVFATETLAAGINMPARTTVISSISKRADEGRRLLSASEFLQMSGRAGRRGMDDLGHVVVLNHPFEKLSDTTRLATSPPDPLSSRFTPSYGMVLNLLQRHTKEETKELIERSFGQFLVNQEIDPWYLQKISWQKEIDKLSKPLCPGEIGDLPLYKKYREIVHSKEKQARFIERGLVKKEQRPGLAEIQDETLTKLQQEVSDAHEQAEAMPCHGCPVQDPCAKQSDRLKILTTKIKDMDRRIEKYTSRYWRTFEALGNVLRLKGYLNADTPTKIGKMAAAIRGTNELFLSEMALSNVFKDLKPDECSAILTALISEDVRVEMSNKARISPTVDILLDDIQRIARKLYKLQRDFDIEVPIDFSPVFSGLSQMWAQGAKWEDIRYVSQFDEGDIVRALRRTLDLARQFIHAPNMPEYIVDLCMATEKLIARDEVREDY